MDEIRGTDALLAMVAGNAEIEGFEVTWEPQEAFVGASGDVGYTRGVNAFTFPDGEGGLVTTRGRYLTIWRKEAGGEWRCFVEMTNEGAVDQSSGS